MRALQALEVCLALFLGVVYNVCALAYVLPAQRGVEVASLGALLRLLGSLHMDVGTFYFLLKGYVAGEFIRRGAAADARGEAGDASLAAARSEQAEIEAQCSTLVDPVLAQRAYVKGILRAVLPHLVLSGALHLVLQGFTCTSCAWDWANILLSPCLLSGFADVRDGNVFRGASEISWLVQDQTLMLIFAFEAYDHLLRQAENLRLVTGGVLLGWLSVFLQVYAGLTQPRYANLITRNVFTNFLFFSSGMLLCILQQRQSFREAAAPYLATLSGLGVGAWAVLAVLVSALYLHHLDGRPGVDAASDCVSSFGGAPCLWAFDVCAGRLLPLQLLALAWLTDCGCLFPPHLGGELAEPLTRTFRSLNASVAAYREYALVWLLYGELLGFGIHSLLSFLLPGLVVHFLYVVLVLEVALIAVLCVYLKQVSADWLDARFARVAAALAL